MGFATDQLNFDLPAELIAQTPAASRSESRLLIVHRETGQLEDRQFTDLTGYLSQNDMLVVNDARVLPARFVLRRETGGRIEGLFLRQTAPDEWEVMLKGAKRVSEGERLAIVSDATRDGDATIDYATTVRNPERGIWIIRWPQPTDAATKLDQTGRMPLPPYIKRDKDRDKRDDLDRNRYQTVFAAHDGAVAAPTAGLHFDANVMRAIQQRGIAMEKVTLHVGYGTFAPVESTDLADHTMHAEYYEITDAVAHRLRAHRESGGRTVAVGTTSTRVLESSFANSGWRTGETGWTELFCYPPFEFRATDALITNFHLPRSTLIALVMAFAGIDLIKRAYAHAIDERYRFYSYGDAMLIL